jgi:type I pantothenate kinase
MNTAGHRPPHTVFSRDEWAALRTNTPLTLSEADLATLRGLNEALVIEEVEQILLPLTRLLNLHISAARNLSRVKDAFLGQPVGKPVYIIALAGSVAVGKSTLARVLRALLARWPDHPTVDLVTTDGFLHPNAVLEKQGLMGRKGFPESYDLRRMIRFLRDVRAGKPRVEAPIYSHLGYDIVPGRKQVVRQADVLIFEGLNVLQAANMAPIVASDFFDFSIYLDAAESDLESWYVERFLLLQKTAFHEPRSYFRHYKDLPVDEATAVARDIWRRINLANLRENILPTRQRANLVLRKQSNHLVEEVWLQRT